MIYILDFWSGSHGHFLEYSINTWIFRGPKISNLFTEVGACHGAADNTDYSKMKKIGCGHYSEFNAHPEVCPNKVVRITVGSFMEKCCYQINVNHRAGDIPKEKKILNVPLAIREKPGALRNDYYSKFMYSENGYPLPSSWKWDDVPNLEINMSSLYNLRDFLISLNRISEFLDNTFSPDKDLVDTWEKFISMNQGLKIWNYCNGLLPSIMSGRYQDIDLDIEQQALLNCILSHTIKLYDGRLFEIDEYPKNTREIYESIKHHVDTLDIRFPD
jgi:hypothetical protein